VTRPRGSLVVFAKRPRPGEVKTRMTPPLTPEQAAELYAHLLDDVLEVTAQMASACALEPVLAVHPESACAELAARCSAVFRVVGQRGANLGERMEWAVQDAAAAGADRILLRGSDSPALDVSVAVSALEALDTHDLVVSPDRDGGYNLIGLRRAAPGLFAHAMSTPRALEDTLEGARCRGWRVAVQPARFDLDTVEDLRWLAAARAQGAEALCPRTLAYCDAQRLWRFARLTAADGGDAPLARSDETR
jgi:rSAM/selenodomain-associated transferase 1